MPRVAEARDAAEPSSAEQRARFARMLAAAAQLGTEKELERVQMHEVAKLAGVAIGTLYRYFPSKTHLFVAVMVDQIDQMGEGFARRAQPASTPQDEIFETLLRATRSLMRQPLLATAMIQATSTAKVTTIPDVARVDRQFREVLFDAAGIEQVTESDSVLVRLLVSTWFGIIQSCLNGRSSVPDAEADLRTACRLLLADLSNARTPTNL
ncbi:TetR family transcriptional regulator [Prescottella subtropica]|uniref:TetR family transcriptional regulator n=1 Tax=Prescottella subtropica TaxID=2545757 RepID=UPI0010F60B9B|nr:TetR family transcriptional regulator [Prescottella subtropica]